MTYKIKKHWSGVGLCLATLLVTLASCIGDGNETILVEGKNAGAGGTTQTTVAGIPSDSEAGASPSVGTATTQMPNIQYAVTDESGTSVLRIDMTGVQEADGGGWMNLVGTGSPDQNVWVTVDGKPKGIQVKNSDGGSGSTRQADLVFTVDNSGSMSEEADAIARDIVEWAGLLSQSGLDAKFGVVGYGGYISGAMDLTTAAELSTFLNASSGTGRTMHFGGNNTQQLATWASGFARTGSHVDDNECGAMAVRFADKYFGFRQGANRVYVNFTDEPNQPKQVTDYSTESFRSQSDWATAQGTVHTVYSSDTTYFSTETMGTKEKPWRLSWYTGGTIIVASSSFTGVTLSSLPVTGALQHSYVIRLTNIDDLMDGQPHEVKITILSKDGKTRSERTFWIVFGEKKGTGKSE